MRRNRPNSGSGAEQGLLNMTGSDVALSIVLGVVLAAATGFRVFLPMLIVSGAAYTGHLTLDNSFAWLGTPFALTMLGVAALVEVLAYYVPGVDNLLAAVATPAAIAAGTIVSAAVMTDLPPMMKWIAAVIAGGGAAGFTQGLTAMLRAKSTAFTGGFGNPVIATGENSVVRCCCRFWLWRRHSRHSQLSSCYCGSHFVCSGNCVRERIGRTTRSIHKRSRKLQLPSPTSTPTPGR